MKTLAFSMIMNERHRQKKLGYTDEHDDKHHSVLALVTAAACYHREPEHRNEEFIETCWPFHPAHFKPSYKQGYDGRIKELAKAGAFYMAGKDMASRTGQQQWIAILTSKIGEVTQAIVDEMKEKEAVCESESEKVYHMEIGNPNPLAVSAPSRS